MKRITKTEVIITTLLVGWTALNVSFLIIGGNYQDYSSYNDLFYPFDKKSTISYDYDFTEFNTFVYIPWAMFVVYFFLIRLVGSNKK